MPATQLVGCARLGREMAQMVGNNCMRSSRVLTRSDSPAGIDASIRIVSIGSAASGHGTASCAAYAAIAAETVVDPFRVVTERSPYTASADIWARNSKRGGLPALASSSCRTEVSQALKSTSGWISTAIVDGDSLVGGHRYRVEWRVQSAPGEATFACRWEAAEDAVTVRSIIERVGFDAFRGQFRIAMAARPNRLVIHTDIVAIRAWRAEENALPEEIADAAWRAEIDDMLEGMRVEAAFKNALIDAVGRRLLAPDDADALLKAFDSRRATAQ